MGFEAKPGRSQRVPSITGYEKYFVFVDWNEFLDQAVTFGRSLKQANLID
jgi:hypothetical protein